MLWPKLRQRNLQPELMDDPALDPDRHRAALAGLARINLLSFSARILWPPLARLARKLHPRPCHVLDIATGGGDLPRALARRARKHSLRLAVDGCDISEVALEYAKQGKGVPEMQVRFFRCDVLREPLPETYDAVICSLFLHHQTADQGRELLRRMGHAARHLVLVNDLARGTLGYLMAWVGTRILTRSRIVHVDGPRSVEGAFTPEEACQLAEEAGLRGATVGRRWPARFLLKWEKSE
jgi:SAM-dependent methyltransferase